MATTKLGLPTITGNMTADVVRDMNALANAVDGKAGAANGLALLNAQGKVINADGTQAGEVTQTEFDGLEQAVMSHLADKANPHGTSKEQVGLGNVDNVKQIPLSEKGQPNGVAMLDAAGNILNGKGEVIGGGNQTGEFTDTTTVIQPLAIYTKRIPLNGKPTAGRIHAVRSNGSYYGVAEFNTKRENSTGYALRESGSPFVGYDKHKSGVFGETSMLGTNISLNGVWINEITKELVLEFKNISPVNASTLAIQRITGTGEDGTTGLIWEVW